MTALPPINNAQPLRQTLRHHVLTCKTNFRASMADLTFGLISQSQGLAGLAEDHFNFHKQWAILEIPTWCHQCQWKCFTSEPDLAIWESPPGSTPITASSENASWHSQTFQFGNHHLVPPLLLMPVEMIVCQAKTCNLEINTWIHPHYQCQ